MTTSSVDITINELLDVLTTEALANIDYKLVITLMALGFAIKHFKFLKNVSNEYIPVIILGASFIFTFGSNGISTVSASAAIVTAAVAIGLHQSGKNFFTVTVFPKLANLLSVTEETTDNTNETGDK